MPVDHTKVHRYHRQWDVFKPTETKIIIGGAGGIGSITSLVLGKMGLLNIHVYDADKVEEHNVSNQFYQLKDIGKHKVEALKHNLTLFTETKVTIHNEFITPDTELNIDNETIVVSGFDSMEARKVLWNKARFRAKAFIDGRMALDDGKIYCINTRNKDEIEFYEKTLIDDKDAYQERCTAQAIIYNVVIIAGFMANKVKKIINGEQYKKEIIFNLKGMGFLIQ